MVWFWSDQRSIRSGRSDHSLYSLDHGLGSVWSEVNSVWKVWSQSLWSGPWSVFGLIRGQFSLEGLISSALFFQFFYWGMLGLPRGNNKAAFRSEFHLKSDDCDQKQGVQLITNSGPLNRKFWLTEDHDVSSGKLSKFIHLVRNLN